MNSRILLRSKFRQLSITSLSTKPICCHPRFICHVANQRLSTNLLLSKVLTPNLQAYRYKKKKPQKQPVREDEDSDEEEEEDTEESVDVLPGQKEKIIKSAQLRLDKILRQALSSGIVENAFLEGRVYRNDEKALKKSVEIIEGDVLDIEVGPDPKNPNFLKVHRVEVVEIKMGGSHNYVRILLSKNLSITPYGS